MWRFNPFTQKEPAGLEGRTVDVGNIKVHVRNVIAEGGFSCVYLARDAMHSSKQYALKHMICNDGESLDLVMKEISVMKMLRGHPNVVMLVSHTILDMGRTKEALLVMEFCEKSLVTVLGNRGAEYFEEKHVLLIFRDVCNAVFTMHCRSPPIAHRDLKVENVLLGSDGAWKLCDFGSTSTNHKNFNRPEEMGIEEDNIRKHTTPAYRAPEMWDLFRREVISEKVDIWALGCLLYRICYLKSAFDGESKLQILNGNYQIPELPKYSASVTGLIKDMLEDSPDVRPDITQVWFRVNEELPVEFRKNLPTGALHDEGVPKKTPLMPQRSPPPVPSSREQVRNISPQPGKVMEQSRPSQSTSKVSGGGGGSSGAFWSTPRAQDSQVLEDKGPLSDKEQINRNKSMHSQKSLGGKPSPAIDHHAGPGYPLRSANENSTKRFNNGPTKDFEMRFLPDGSSDGSQKTRASQPDSKATIQNEAFNTFVAEFDTNKFNSGNNHTNGDDGRSRKLELEAEVDRLKEQLKQSNLEKSDIKSKYEKLSAICRSQRQELQELKRSLAASTPSPPSKDSSTSQIPTASVQSSAPDRDKIEGGLWELQQGMFANSSAFTGPDPKIWQAFGEDPKAQTARAGLVRPASSHQNTTMRSSAGPANDTWGFGLGSLASAAAGPQMSRTCVQGNTSQRLGGSETKKVETNQPSGWAGF